MQRRHPQVGVLLRRGNLIPLVLVLLAALFFHTWWGIRKELPYLTHPDEPASVKTAVRMAAEASLNPREFGYPGSTVVYPLAAVFRLRHLLMDHGPLWGPAPGIAAAFERNGGAFYLLGRSVSVLYAVLGVLAVYLVGNRAFGRKAGLLGAWLSILCPLAVSKAQLVRIDSASAFFGLVGLYVCLRLYQRPGWRSQVIAGACIGLAIATKYSLIPLLGVFALANLFLLMEGKRKPVRLAEEIAGGLAAVVLAFVLATPFFLIELNTAIGNIRFEMRSTHLGQDGLSLLGNLRWYLSTVIPRSLKWPRVLLAVVACVYALVDCKPARLLVLAYPMVLLAGISSSSLHWPRWIIPILPVISLLAAWIMVDAVGWVTARISAGKLLNGVGLAATIFAVSYAPARDVVRMNIQQSRPSTRILAREWVAANLPEGAVIAQEWYTAPLQGLPFKVVGVYHLPHKSFEYYRSAGVRYFLATSLNYGRYFAEPQRYAAEVAFYRRLFDEGSLLREFSPSSTVPGQTVRIYELDP